jgi:hypothetical protein
MDKIGDRARALVTSAGGSPQKRANSSVQRVLDERMSLSEAIEAATRIVVCYPNGGREAGKSYLGALAHTLASYPRQVALRCAERGSGVVSECKFLPTVADLIAWCERAVAPLHGDFDRGKRLEEQFKIRAEYERDQAERLNRLSVDELKEKYGDWTKDLRGGEEKPSPFPAEPRQIDASEIVISPFLVEAIRRARAGEPA